MREIHHEGRTLVTRLVDEADRFRFFNNIRKYIIRSLAITNVFLSLFNLLRKLRLFMLYRS